MAVLSASHATAHRLAAQPSATHAWKGPQGDMLVDALEHGHRVAACRGKHLAAVVVLLRSEACRSPGLAGMRGASRQVPCDALVGLPGKLLLPGPCLLDLNTLFLNGSKGAMEYLGGHPASPCRGALQLSVHKFGVLGYPYSSTPTGAPRPGPHTVPSAVGLGPKQGTGTRGLGYAGSFSVSTAPPQRHASNAASWERSWVVSLLGRAKRPPPPSL